MNQAVDPTAPELDVVIVGAGFSGLYMLHKLREQGRLVKVLEAASDVGGVWHWNRYPGARCDIESMDYSYSFSEELQQEWEWAERNATQPEILRYINHVADRFDLRRDIELNTEVVSTAYDEGSNSWRIVTGDGRALRARFVVTAVGCLSRPQRPEVEGLEDFAGSVYHTGEWPDDARLAGLRVGVVGTGSSGIQVIPEVAKVAGHLTVFQRTPHYSVPALNRRLEPEYVKAWKSNYTERRAIARSSRLGVSGTPDASQGLFEVSDEQRRETFDGAWASGTTRIGRTFTDILTSPDANEVVATYVRERIREQITDPTVAELVTPRDYYFGTKRLCMDSGYYASFNSPNVSLVDIKKHPIQRVTRNGILAGDHEIKLDVIIFATGFDAITGSLLKLGITGRGGTSLREEWAAGPRSYLGLASTNFPNLFTITGPGSPSVLSNMLTSVEQHVEWIADCLAFMRSHGHEYVEADPAAQDRWVHTVNQVADATLLTKGTASYYVGANVPGKPRVFMPYAGGVGAYRQICDDVVRDGYRGFRFASNRNEATSSAADHEEVTA